MTFSFSGLADLCLVGGPVTTGRTADATSPRERVTCFTGLVLNPHTLVLTVTSAESYVIDGYYVAP